MPGSLRPIISYHVTECHLLTPRQITRAQYRHDQAVLLKHSMCFQSVISESQIEMTHVFYMNHFVHSLMHNQLQAPMYRSVICVVCCHTNNIMPSLRFSQEWWWRFNSSGMWCHVAGWVILAFQRIVLPSSSREAEGSIILQTVWPIN
jgi:hypothetical protein